MGVLGALLHQPMLLSSFASYEHVHENSFELALKRIITQYQTVVYMLISQMISNLIFIHHRSAQDIESILNSIPRVDLMSCNSWTIIVEYRWEDY